MESSKSFERRSIGSRTTIFGEGQPGDNAYLIVSGRVEIRKGTATENPRIIAVLGPGDVVGEMALFDERPRMAEAVTLEDTEVIVVARDEFLKRLNEMNPVMKRMLQIMVGRVRGMTDEFMKRKGDSQWDDQSNGAPPAS
ncbi:MAG: Crp/Fnr family transcriptional regulator [Alphaproteobacteria bacterium]|nr:Crp/Fnr family transcriptional regulator [Alphaproteobacteria bacterium]